MADTISQDQSKPTLPSLQYKTIQAEFKALGTEGQYEGYFSVFGNLDDGSDVMMPGAFTKTIQERRNRIKVFYAHNWERLIGPPPDIIQEDSRGLYAKGRLTLGSFWGREVWALMSDGALTEGSIGYEAIRFEFDSAKWIRYIQETKLYEISPVPLGMNPLTEIAAVKMLRQRNEKAFSETLLMFVTELKAGARHSANDAKLLQQIHDMAIELGACCPDGEEPPMDDMPVDDEMSKGAASLARLHNRSRAVNLALALNSRSSR